MPLQKLPDVIQSEPEDIYLHSRSIASIHCQTPHASTRQTYVMIAEDGHELKGSLRVLSPITRYTIGDIQLVLGEKLHRIITALLMLMVVHWRALEKELPTLH